MNKAEFEQGIKSLDPKNLYTQETRVYRGGLGKADLSEPINYGRDRNRIAYVTDGNHKARKALDEGEFVLGRHIANGNFDVTRDIDFRLISELEIVER